MDICFACCPVSVKSSGGREVQAALEHPGCRFQGTPGAGTLQAVLKLSAADWKSAAKDGLGRVG